MARTGRPTKYTDELADEICEAIRLGASLREIEATEGMPSRSTIWRWYQGREDFRSLYVRAREVSAYSFEDRALGYCDRLERATSVTEVQGLKEAAQILRWAASVRAPKTHGDLTKLEHTGGGGEPLKVVVEMPPEGGA